MTKYFEQSLLKTSHSFLTLIILLLLVFISSGCGGGGGGGARMPGTGPMVTPEQPEMPEQPQTPEQPQAETSCPDGSTVPMGMHCPPEMKINLNEYLTESLKEYLTEAIEQRKAPGIVTAIVDEQGVRAIGASGVRRQGSPDKITVHDQLHIGSNTKAMTSTMLATLVKDGTFANGWETTIKDVFPELIDIIHQDYHSVQLSQLIRMRGGISRNAENWRGHRDIPDIANRRYEILKDNLMNPPITQTGEFLYSNLSYMIAGAMAEKLTGKSWETLMQERLFVPLGITTAGFGAPGTPGRVEQPWGHGPDERGVWVPRQFDNDPAIGPAGTVHISAEDWVKFISLWFENKEPAILDRSSLNELARPVGEYAAGWEVLQRSWAGGTVLYHSGTNRYWLSYLWLAPKSGVAYLAVANISDLIQNIGVGNTLDSIFSRLITDTEQFSRNMGGEEETTSSPGRNILLDALRENSALAEGADIRIRRAARSRSTFGTYQGIGHTTQSSYSISGQTSDKISFTFEYGANGNLHFTRTRRLEDNTFSFSASTKDAGVYVERLSDTPVTGWKGVESRSRSEINERDTYTTAYSDIDSNADMDYLAFGLWLVGFKDANGDYTGFRFGTAASGNDPFDANNFTGLTGSATYEGPASGMYMSKVSSTTAPVFDYFDATARLTAIFGDATTLGSVTGNITGARTDGGIALPNLTLGSADITNSFSGGNFDGETSGSGFSGKWAAKFFGNSAGATDHPGSIAGTFGANSSDNLRSILGSFGAYKQ